MRTQKSPLRSRARRALMRLLRRRLERTRRRAPRSVESTRGGGLGGLLRLLARGGLGLRGLFGVRLGSGGSARLALVDELDHAHRRVVAATATELDDARVATRASRKALRQVDEHLFDQVDLGALAARLRHLEATEEATHLLLRGL